MTIKLQERVAGLRGLQADTRKCTVCDKLKSEHGNAFGAPDHAFTSFNNRSEMP